jgi:lipoprotein-anchoring transpeptidase ErfK/SrfK
MWGAGPVVLFVALSLLAAGGAGSAYAAYRYERAHHSKILPGVRIAGVDVGDMNRGEALAALRNRLDHLLQRKISVRAGDRTAEYSLAQLGLSADPTRAVTRALRLSRSYSWVARVYHRLTHKPVGRSVGVAFSFDPARVNEVVRAVGNRVDVPAQDAGIQYVNEQTIEMVHSKPGRALRAFVSRNRLRKAVLSRHAKTVRFPMMTVQPKVTDAHVGKTIVVNRTTNMLTLYDGFHVERRYPVATAMQGFLTPSGSWQVIDKVEWPTWHNPCLGQPGCWAASEPAEIPPGPDNPLGTRALYLSAPGIRIHGTPSDSSIGTYASHGCIRMHIPESEALYPLVPVGTKVIIMGAPPWGDSVPTGPAG